MEALYFGSALQWGHGQGAGPWVMADLENGLFAGTPDPHPNPNPNPDGRPRGNGLSAGEERRLRPARRSLIAC